MKVVIVGGGIIGLAAAWAVARAGHDVELCERASLPNPLASSSDDSRLIRFPYGAKRNYARMVAPAYRAIAHVSRDLAVDVHIPTGTLIVAGENDPSMRACIGDLEALAVPYDVLKAGQVATRFPLLVEAPGACGLWTPTGGVLLARRLLHALISWLDARDNVLLRPQTRVTAVDRASARVETATGAEIRGDRLIIAAGPWAPDLLPDFAGRLEPSRQVVVELDASPDTAASWSTMPMVLDGIAAGGSGFYAVPPVAGLNLKIGDHGLSHAGHPDQDRVPTHSERQRILELARTRLASADAYAPVAARTCFYTRAAEERFVAEAGARALVLAGFSGHGFKFGPLIGLAVQAWCEDRLHGPSLERWLAGHMPEAPACLDLVET